MLDIMNLSVGGLLVQRRVRGKQDTWSGWGIAKPGYLRDFDMGYWRNFTLGQDIPQPVKSAIVNATEGELGAWVLCAFHVTHRKYILDGFIVRDEKGFLLCRHICHARANRRLDAAINWEG